MSTDTPRTDAESKHWDKFGDYPYLVMRELARTLERELNAANAEMGRLRGDLQYIAESGGKTVQTEFGEMHCSGFWCAEQASASLQGGAR